MDTSGVIVTDNNIYEFQIEPSLRVSDKFIIWYAKSGQPSMTVLKGLFTREQAQDWDFISDKILEQEE